MIQFSERVILPDAFNAGDSLITSIEMHRKENLCLSNSKHIVKIPKAFHYGIISRKIVSTIVGTSGFIRGDISTEPDESTVKTLYVVDENEKRTPICQFKDSDGYSLSTYQKEASEEYKNSIRARLVHGNSEFFEISSPENIAAVIREMVDSARKSVFLYSKIYDERFFDILLTVKSWRRKGMDLDIRVITPNAPSAASKNARHENIHFKKMELKGKPDFFIVDGKRYILQNGERFLAVMDNAAEGAREMMEFFEIEWANSPQFLELN